LKVVAPVLLALNWSVAFPAAAHIARPTSAHQQANHLTRHPGHGLRLATRSRCPEPHLSLALAIEDSLQARYDSNEIARVMSSWRRMSEGIEHDAALPGGDADPMLRQQSNSYIQGLSVQLFHDARRYPWAQHLEREWSTVREEFLSMLRGDELERRGNNVWVGLADVRDTGTSAYGPEWRTLGLQDRGVWDPVNTKLFPKTTALLHESGTPCVEAFFAKMPAGSKISPHSDGCNFHLTAHLGIDVPEGECWLQVGNERREWRNGEVMLFDTSVLHRASNEAVTDRYVLMMRVWHPELTPVEVDALSWIFRCLDEPELAMAGARPPPAAALPAMGAHSGGQSRQERRKAERAAKKAAKKARKR